MGTRSRIGVERMDGTIESIYCHWDGYWEWNGKLLFESFQDLNKINELIALGNISSLREKVVPDSISHTFEQPQDDVVIAYMRDREETGQEARIDLSLDSLVKDCGSMWEEFLYLYRENEGQWFAGEIELSLINDLPVYAVALKPLVEELVTREIIPFVSSDNELY